MQDISSDTLTSKPETNIQNWMIYQLLRWVIKMYLDLVKAQFHFGKDPFNFVSLL